MFVDSVSSVQFHVLSRTPEQRCPLREGGGGGGCRLRDGKMEGYIIGD